MGLNMMSDSEKEEFIEYAIEKVYFFIDSQFWSKFDVSKVQSWMQNFRSLDERYCAAKLLDRFVYYSEDDVIQLLKHGLNELFLRRDYLRAEDESGYSLTNDELQSLKNQFIRKTALLPLSEGNPTESSHAVARILSNEIGFPEQNVLSPSNLESDYFNNFDRILIIDDFVGSGDQIIEFWNLFDTKVDEESIKMYEFPHKFPNIDIQYFCLVVTKEGYDRFYNEELEHMKNLTIRYCEMLPTKFKIFGDDSVYFDQEEREECKAIIQNLISDKGFGLTGYRQLEYAVAFHHCIPDASLPLFYEKKENWNYLLRNKRTQEHVEI
ncbi:phosphoribosyltransferase-like protein [Sanyastnella coralliicola]|uniref:phosphoribosyltransferase-like protein n=1 Tax=Sanyastnella coralliicola TaxID=3069118 RepID=UPI0027B8A11E|nr:hypothetical protein [Longitalea sp. SCSIO 12813]